MNEKWSHDSTMNEFIGDKVEKWYWILVVEREGRGMFNESSSLSVWLWLSLNLIITIRRERERGREGENLTNTGFEWEGNKGSMAEPVIGYDDGC